MGKKALVIKYSDAWDRMSHMRTRDHKLYNLSWDAYRHFCSTPSMIADRSNCETDTTLLQIIPYIVLYRQLEDDLAILTYVRGKGGTETRLHDKLSVGLGGHIERLPDYPKEGLDKVIYEAAVRELEEELGTSFVNESIRHSLAKTLLISSLEEEPCLNGITPSLYHTRITAVDEVHLGIFTMIPIASTDIDMDLEKDVIEGVRWRTFTELKSDSVYDRLESWSKAVIDNLNHVLI